MWGTEVLGDAEGGEGGVSEPLTSAEDESEAMRWVDGTAAGEDDEE